MIISALPGSFGVVIVDFVAIDEGDYVGVLLDRARLAQVGQQRAALGAGLDLRG